jgi:hypothetical protein
MRLFSGRPLKAALIWLTTAALAVAVVGCESNPLSGAKLYPVKGTVLLPDGKPLTSGHVVFVGTGSTITSSANIESDGSFAFKGAAGEGLPPGEYKVRIEPGSDGKARGGKSKNAYPFAEQFLDEDASGLTATVTDDGAKNSFELKLNPTKAAAGAAVPRGGR